jgi:hypothetical protein
MVIGGYVGAATVGGAAYWFMYDPTGPQMSFYQLSHHMQCYGSPEEFKGISCEIFQVHCQSFASFFSIKKVFLKHFIIHFVHILSIRQQQ